MKEIKIQNLSLEEFGKYGDYLDLKDNKKMQERSIFSENFFADLISLEFGTGNLPTISICDVIKQEKKIVNFLETHQHTCEGLLPLDGDVVIFVGLPVEPYSVDNLKAFYVPQGTFIKLNPLIVHGTQYPVDRDEVHVLCLLPGRTFKNDMNGLILDEKDQAILID
jgi:ureidoglycolate hydrolase